MKDTIDLDVWIVVRFGRLEKLPHCLKNLRRLEMVDKEISQEHNKIVGDVGRIIVGVIMIFIAVSQLFKIFELDSSMISILLLFGGIGNIMWGIRK